MAICSGEHARRRTGIALLPALIFFMAVAGRAFEAQAGEPTAEVKISRVVVRGNDHFSVRRAKEMLGVSPGDVITAAEAAARADRLLVFYRADGYALAEVTATIGGVASDELFVDVSEGPRVAVSAIQFEGNKAVPTGTLREAVKTRVRWRIAFLRPGRFVQARFDEDVRNVQSLLVERGYLDAEAAGNVVYNAKKTRVTLRITVHEGPLYHIDAVTFAGNTLFLDEELAEALPFAVGDAYKLAQLTEAHGVIARLYGDCGRMDVARPGALTIDPLVDPQTARVTVRVSVVEGPQIRIGRIQIRGLLRTKEHVVRRSLKLNPGEVARLSDFEKNERLLANTGYFEGGVGRAADITLAPGEEEVRDVIVRVREAVTENLLVGLGIGEDGLTGDLTIRGDDMDLSNWPSSWHDLFYGNALRGGGQRLAILVRAGTEVSQYSISFLDPSVADGPFSFGAEIYARSRAYSLFDESRTGASIEVGQNLTDYVRHSLALGYEEVDIDDIDTNAPAEVMLDDGAHPRPFARYLLAHDTRDNRFMPATGHLLSAQTELAGGYTDAVSIILEGRKYWTVYENSRGNCHVLALGGQLGVMDGLGGDDRVPVYDRFYAGGAHSLRGFRLRGVSPIDPFTEDQIGGESIVLGTVEYSLPVTSDNSLRALAFVDFGYVEDDARNVMNGWARTRISAGIGARWRIPGMRRAQIRADLAFPIREETGDETQNFHFTIGLGTGF